MRFSSLRKYSAFVAGLALCAFQWSCSSNTSLSSPTNNYSVPPNPTSLMVSASTYVPASLPSGNFAVGTLVNETVSEYGVTISSPAAEVLLLTNGVPVSTAGVTIVDNTIPYSYSIPYSIGVTYNGHGLSEYINSGITYTPGDSYSLAVSFPSGTVTSSALTAPGPISFSSNGASVTCNNAGNYQVAMAIRDYPSPALTYESATPASLGSPFTYPGSAYSTPASPATFFSVYAAAATVYSFSGPSPATGNAFVAMDFYEDEVTR